MPAGAAEFRGPLPNSRTYCAKTGTENTVLARRKRAQRTGVRPSMGISGLTSADVQMAAYDNKKGGPWNARLNPVTAQAACKPGAFTLSRGPGQQQLGPVAASR